MGNWSWQLGRTELLSAFESIRDKGFVKIKPPMESIEVYRSEIRRLAKYRGIRIKSELNGGALLFWDVRMKRGDALSLSRLEESS